MITPSREIPRRAFLGKLSAAAFLTGLLPTAARASADPVATSAEKGTGELTFLTKPYLQNPSATGMSVAWITSAPCVSWIEYGETEKLGILAKPTVDGLVSNFVRVNSVNLSGLRAGAVYHYRVVAQEILGDRPFKLNLGKIIYSQSYQFNTFAADPETASVLVYNDLHNRPETIPWLFSLTKDFDPDFVFFNGDVFDKQVSGEPDIIKNMLAPSAEVFAATKPFIMTRGNHDTYGKFASHLFGYFPNRDGKFYGSFRLGPIQFVILDTGDAGPDNEFTSFDAYRERQARWLETEMKSASYQQAPFRIVLMHIPHFHTNNEFHTTQHLRELYAKMFNENRVDLTLSGHTHTLGLHPAEAGKHDYPVVIGGGPNDGNRTITKITANPRELTLKMIRDDGKEVIAMSIPARAARA